MPDAGLRVPRWVAVLVLSLVLGVVGKLTWYVWEEHIEDFKRLNRVVDTLAREFKGE